MTRMIRHWLWLCICQAHELGIFLGACGLLAILVFFGLGPGEV